jgi:hypothetical protein
MICEKKGTLFLSKAFITSQTITLYYSQLAMKTFLLNKKDNEASRST